jgi:hypothetical protein
MTPLHLLYLLTIVAVILFVLVLGELWATRRTTSSSTKG